MVRQLRGKTVLITGGAGFIGSHLADALVSDNQVRILDNLSTGEVDRIPDSAVFYEGDIRDSERLAEAMSGVDVVFHQAAVVDLQRSVQEPLDTNDVNCSGTLAILEQAREEDARVVVASSAAVYGRPEGLPIAEAHDLRPLSPYGLQKLATDRYALMYYDLYGLETVSLRYFNVYGSRRSTGRYSGVIREFLRRAARNEPLVVYGDGMQTRDFVHVDDVVDANIRAATTDDVGDAYNVGTGESVSIKQLAEIVIGLSDSTSTLTLRESRPGDIVHSRADISRICDRLGFEPTVSLEDGLRRLIDESE